MNYSYRFTSTLRILRHYHGAEHIRHYSRIKIHFMRCVGVGCGAWCAMAGSRFLLFQKIIHRRRSLSKTQRTHMSAATRKSLVFRFLLHTTPSTHPRFIRNVHEVRDGFCVVPNFVNFHSADFSPPLSISFTLASFLAGFFRYMYIPPPLCRHVCHRDNQLRNACRYLGMCV